MARRPSVGRSDGRSVGRSDGRSVGPSVNKLDLRNGLITFSIILQDDIMGQYLQAIFFLLSIFQFWPFGGHFSSKMDDFGFNAQFSQKRPDNFFYKFAGRYYGSISPDHFLAFFNFSNLAIWRPFILKTLSILDLKHNFLQIYSITFF